VVSRCRVGLQRAGSYLLDDAEVVFAMHVCHSKPLIRRESPPRGMGKTERGIASVGENRFGGRVELLAAALQGALEHGPVQVVRRSRCVGCRWGIRQDGTRQKGGTQPRDKSRKFCTRQRHR